MSVCGACLRSRYFAIVGTSVRDRMNDQTIANITASAIGTNRKRATPVRKNIGTNTMQMHSSETKAGVTICVGAVEDRAARPPCPARDAS